MVFFVHYISSFRSFADSNFTFSVVFSIMNVRQHPLSEIETSIPTIEQTELNERAIKAILRKIDLRLMPLLTLLYFFNLLDRLSISKIRTGIAIDVHMNILFFFQRTFRLALARRWLRCAQLKEWTGINSVFGLVCK